MIRWVSARLRRVWSALRAAYRVAFPIFTVSAKDVVRLAPRLFLLTALPSLPTALLLAKLESVNGFQPLGFFEEGSVVGAFELVYGAAVSLTALRLLMGLDRNVGSALRFAFRRWLSCGEIVYIVGEMTGIGFILAIAPGVVVFVYTSLAMPALAFGANGSYEALRASREAARRGFWPLLMLLVACTLFSGLIDAGLSVALGFAVSGFWSDFFVQSIELTVSSMVSMLTLAATARAFQAFSGALPPEGGADAAIDVSPVRGSPQPA